MQTKLQSVIRHFDHTKRNPILSGHSAFPPITPIPSSQTIINSFFSSMDLPIFQISNKLYM